MEVVTVKYTFDGTYQGGQYDAYGPDGPFPAWCADPQQYLHFMEPIEYVLVDGLEAWGTSISGSLDQLMSWAEVVGAPSNAEQSTTMQQCIWNLLVAEPCSLPYAGTQVTQHASLLFNTTRQDLLVSQPAVEPETLVLVGLGLLASYMVSRFITK